MIAAPDFDYLTSLGKDQLISLLLAQQVTTAGSSSQADVHAKAECKTEPPASVASLDISPSEHPSSQSACPSMDTPLDLYPDAQNLYSQEDFADTYVDTLLGPEQSAEEPLSSSEEEPVPEGTSAVEPVAMDISLEHSSCVLANFPFSPIDSPEEPLPEGTSAMEPVAMSISLEQSSCVSGNLPESQPAASPEEPSSLEEPIEPLEPVEDLYGTPAAETIPYDTLETEHTLEAESDLEMDDTGLMSYFHAAGARDDSHNLEVDAAVEVDDGYCVACDDDQKGNQSDVVPPKETKSRYSATNIFFEITSLY